MARFPSFLTQYYENTINIVNFTIKTTRVIAESMSQQQFATTSYPIFFRYRAQNRDWLLIALLKLKEGTGINQETFDLNDSLVFDVSHLREAARIDITKWNEKTQPYLSFIKKGSGSDSESSKYFRNALSCQDCIDAKFHTDAALKAAKDFCSEQDSSAEKKQKESFLLALQYVSETITIK